MANYCGDCGCKLNLDNTAKGSCIFKFEDRVQVMESGGEYCIKCWGATDGEVFDFDKMDKQQETDKLNNKTEEESCIHCTECGFELMQDVDDLYKVYCPQCLRVVCS